MRRVVVFGLDGASWDFLDRMMDLGSMPNLKRLLAGGARGVLESSFPPITPSAWPSITTGVNPGKHGIFDFVKTNYESGEQKLTTTRDLEHPRIYEMLAMRGIETMIFNPIPPYPIVPLKNLKVASVVFSPKPACHPKSMEKYSTGFPDYTEIPDATGRSLDKELYLELKLQRTYQRLAVVEEALNQESWSLAWIRIQDPDDLLHAAADEAYSGHAKVKKIFSMIDQLIGVSRRMSDLVVLVSDHGFKRYIREISINTLLFKEGLIRPEGEHALADQVHGWAQEHMLGRLLGNSSDSGFRPPSWLLNMLTTHDMPLFTKLGNIALRVVNRPYQLPRVDPAASRAYSPTPYGDGVFVRDAADLELTRNVLMRQEGIVSVKDREQVYWGPYVRRTANLIIMMDSKNGYRHGSNRIMRRVCEETRTWDHDLYGVIAFAGEGIPSGELGLVSSWDVTPTIMSYIGAPLADDFDGAILSQVANKTRPEQHDYTSNWREIKSSSIGARG